MLGHGDACPAIGRAAQPEQVWWPHQDARLVALIAPGEGYDLLLAIDVNANIHVTLLVAGCSAHQSTIERDPGYECACFVGRQELQEPAPAIAWIAGAHPCPCGGAAIGILG